MAEQTPAQQIADSMMSALGYTRATPAPEQAPHVELRAAATRLRDTEHHGLITGDNDNDELLQLISGLLRAREPLADLLELLADLAELDQARGYRPARQVDAALLVARAINGRTT